MSAAGWPWRLAWASVLFADGIAAQERPVAGPPAAAAPDVPVSLRDQPLLTTAVLGQPPPADEPTPPLSASAVIDLFGVADGGLRRGLVTMEKLDLYLDGDLGFLGLGGVTGHADAQAVFGGSLAALVGDAQVSSNIDAPSGLRPLEAWLSAPVGRRVTVKAGLVDLNVDFDVQAVGSYFINSSHGIGPDFSQTGLNGPSIFPTTSVGLVARHDGERLSLRFGAFDALAADPERVRRTVLRFPGQSGLLLVAEADRRLGDAAMLQVGAWTYTSSFDPLEEGARPRADNCGLYGLVEGRVARVGGRELKAWVRAGVANDRINPIGLYIGGGAVLVGDDNVIGLAVSRARLGDPAVRAGAAAGPRPERAETTIEVTYSRALSPRLTLQPDLQYTFNPGWNPAVCDAALLGIRMIATYP